MSLRSCLILAAIVMAIALASPVEAAPVAQTTVDQVGEINLDEVEVSLVVTSTSIFTLTVLIDEVTTLAIPMQVEWRAEGPNAENPEEVTVVSVPTVLRTGFFSVTVGAVEPTTGTLALTLTQPVEEITPITPTTAPTDTVPTDTAPVTTTAPITGTTPTTASIPADVPTTNAISNLRAGPGTDFAVVGTVAAGEPLDIVGQNGDGSWFALSNGAWIAAFLVNNAPAGLPVVEATAAPPPSLEPSTILTPTATPELPPTAIPTVTPTVAP